MPRIHFILALALGWLALLATAGSAQLKPVGVEVDPRYVGIQGRLAPGQWNGIRLTLDHRGDQPREVVCRWLLTDRDQDRVIAQRTLTLDAQRQDQHAWLYAAVPNPTTRSPSWQVQVLDAETDTLLASTRFGPRGKLSPVEQVIGVMGTAELGLGRYTNRSTRHEAIRLVRGMAVSDLPDRWFGLAGLSALIWTPQAAAPVDSDLPDRSKLALRRWVRRGGHLIISLPAVNETWSDSTLSDLLPVRGVNFRTRSGVDPPPALFPVQGEPARIDLTVFDLPAQSNAAALVHDRQNNPFIVAGRFGFGRVTLIGLDLTSPPVMQMGLPAGRYRIWNTIFRWQGPALSKSTIESRRQNTGQQGPTMDRPHNRQVVEPDRFIPGMIAMRNTAAPMLLGAVLLFALYWLLAGPVSFFVLKQRGLVHYSWLGFLAVVVIFGLLSWGGALATQPSESRVSHFSVVTARHGSEQVKTQSWFSLFVPDFGRTRVALGPDQPEAPNTLAAPGMPRGSGSAGFSDRRQYTLDAATPNSAAIPFRATAKQLQVDYHGPLHREQPGTTSQWVMPQGQLRIENHWPVGKLGHGLPGALHDVMLVYCPGDGDMPWVWRYGQWNPDEVLDVTAGRSGNMSRLVRRPSGGYQKQRNWAAQEGFLGQLMAQKTGRQFMDITPGRLNAADSELVKAIEMLSFYQALPPPNFRSTDFTSKNVNVQRTLGRALDITHLTQGKRLIVMGVMKQAPLPAPLTADGEAVEAEGWTVVRWIYDFPQ